MTSLSLEIQDGIPVITLATPDGENRVDTAMLKELEIIISKIEAEGYLSAIITGYGGNFCLGGDLGRLTAMSYSEIESFGRTFTDTLLHITKCRIILIAAVNGPTVGGGVSLVEACDLAVASDTATFAIPEINGGMPPVISYTGMLRAVGRKKANEHALLCTSLTADEAVANGLVNRIVPQEELSKTTLLLAKAAHNAGTLPVREIKTLASRIELEIREMQLRMAADRLNGIMMARVEE